MVWGLNYRLIADRFDNSAEIRLDPDEEILQYYSAFVQDKIRIFDRLNLTLGVKFEHNDYTGLEIQPSARALWAPNDRHSFWGAVSRASRVPSRVEHDGIINSVLFPEETSEDRPVLFRQIGNGDLTAEDLIAYEIGYRFQPTRSLWLDVTGFYNDYDNLIAYRYDDETVASPDPAAYVVIPVHFDNNLDGQSLGAELAAYWQAMPIWLLQLSYTFLETDLNQSFSTEDATEAFLIQASNPRNQVSLRSALNITPQLELDLWLRYVDRLTDTDVDDYASMDARLAWRPHAQWELSVVGQNLLEPRHAEFSSIEVERSVYFKADWTF